MGWRHKCFCPVHPSVHLSVRHVFSQFLALTKKTPDWEKIRDFGVAGDKIDEDQRIDNRIKYELWAQSEGIEVKDDECVLCREEYNENRRDIAACISKEYYEQNKERISEIYKQKVITLTLIFPHNALCLENNTFRLWVSFLAICDRTSH